MMASVLAFFRRDLRAGEPAQILACAVLGVGVGVAVDLLRRSVMQQLGKFGHTA